MGTKKVARIGDTSDHSGIIITSNQDGTVTNEGKEIAVNGALHQCPISGHGITAITAITTKEYINGKLIVTIGAQASCGAIISTGSPNLYAE